jgi:hypothetical protein
MPDIRLAIPRLQVTLADGRRYVVQALNPDLLAYDRTAAKHHWPGGSQAPFLWLTFLAWSASRRAGDIDADLTWEQFSESECHEVRNLTEEPEGDSTNGSGVADYADPTLPVVVPG